METLKRLLTKHSTGKTCHTYSTVLLSAVLVFLLACGGGGSNSGSSSDADFDQALAGIYEGQMESIVYYLGYSYREVQQAAIAVDNFGRVSGGTVEAAGGNDDTGSPSSCNYPDVYITGGNQISADQNFKCIYSDGVTCTVERTIRGSIKKQRFYSTMTGHVSCDDINYGFKSTWDLNRTSSLGRSLNTSDPIMSIIDSLR